MQTDLRNRDLIGDLDFSKEEVETVLDVAFDLKRKRALGESHRLFARQGAGDAVLLQQHPHPRFLRSGHGPTGRPRAFIESKTTQIAHGDTETEMGEIFGRYFDGIAIRHVTWGTGNRYLNLVAKASRVPVLNMQCDVYHPFQCLADLMTIMEKKGATCAAARSSCRGPTPRPT
jgi:ornithine carbamoyltransferase